MNRNGDQSRFCVAGGFMLVEMLIVIGMLAVVALVAGQLFQVINHAQREAAAQQMQEAQLDQAIRQLRTDVWRASSIEVRGSDALRLNLPNGQEIDWEAGKILARKSLSLSEDEPQRQWKDLGATLSFSPRGAGVVVEVLREHKPEGRVELISQSMLLSGRSR